ncbi:hypothetical protein HDZ31DRAFT_85463 [Schizophyllum fasciatum]
MSRRSRQPKTRANVEDFDLESLRNPPPPLLLQTDESQRLTSDNHRLRVEEVDIPISPPRKRRRLSVISSGAYHGGEGVSESASGNHIDGAHPIGASGQPWKRKYYIAADEPLREFTKYIDEYMEEFMRVDGRGDAAGHNCPTCVKGEERPALYRCTECTGPSMYCSSCIVQVHAKCPFCRIQEWGGVSFQAVSLGSLGMAIQLCHPDGELCAHATLAANDFVVMDINGFHHIPVYQCGCVLAPNLRQQLLRHRLFPATPIAPRTACTFGLLEHFSLLTLHGKVTSYDYYHSLEKATDGIDVTGVKDRYKVFIRCSREWRCLKVLKRGGRGNDCKRRATDVRPGELAVRCPACPIPGENLPPDWQNAPKEKEYLYFLAIALDACFRLKRRQVSTAEKDPRILDGSAYIVSRTPFEGWIKTADKQDETTSSCSGLSAIEHANTKFAKGYAETGKGIGVCARHEFVQANGVVPLQVGERYANMDYALGSLLKNHNPALKVILSYDIACQFSKNLIDRVKRLPPMLRFKAVALTMRFVVPKLHILGHRSACQLLFNIAYLFGGARTDGEGVERPWAHLGPLGTSLRQMGPGSAADTLDDHLGYWNWLKLIGLGRFLLRKLLEALKEEAIQRTALDEFSREQADHVPEWTQSVLAFERDTSQPNPFEASKSGATEAEVQLELAEKEAAGAARGEQHAHDLSPVDLVSELLSVEEQQRNLAANVAERTYNTAKQKADLFRQQSKISRVLNKLASAQKAYMPSAAPRLDAWVVEDSNGEAYAESRPLLLPSSLPRPERDLCLGDIASLEQRLRHVQCRTALDDLRNQILARTRDIRFKTSNVRHQGSNTRALNILKAHDNKVARFAKKYIFARSALIALADGDAEKVPWRELDVHRDLRGMQDPDASASYYPHHADGAPSGAAPTTPANHLQRLRAATGEGRRTLSWIWYGANTHDPEAQSTELYEGVRVEWCKAFARVRRWQEQIELLKEEQRRTTVSLRRRGEEWRKRLAAEARVGPVGEGARAYAARQARVFAQLVDHFETLWSQAPAAARIDLSQARKLEADLAAADRYDDELLPESHGNSAQPDDEDEDEDDDSGSDDDD